MFMLNNGGAIMLAMPDVCNTPIGPIVVPLPYPNTGTTEMADPGGLVQKVLVVGMPALNLGSKITLTEGDQAGSLGGVVSGKTMGEACFLVGSARVRVGGKPAVRLTAQTGQNGAPPNVQGSVVAPSQTTVSILS
ncbi:DUF4150 domain-containing protein [Pandoraea pulmonicola]|uniref:Type VI secretion protein n=1 Tax=Pandoraea pulmonicola TaxID=93221 RepID=A0AAJ5CYG8_PANPU|nr:DUF4150 domain-containing protein [Pandoraea pulmonicola]AJC22330.1 type VI secretion protein [Pandoraea pulmonicola]SUA88564.1 Uncharacterised protein [Pandoraea pulmonicola]